MRSSAVLLLLILAGFCSCQKRSDHQLYTPVKFEQQKFEDALILAKQQDKLLMVDFWSAG